MAECSQRKLFMMLDPQKDNSRRKQVSVREETTPHMQGQATNDAQSFGDMTTVQSRGLQKATSQSQAITANMNASATANIQAEKNCMMQPVNKTVLSSTTIFSKSLGVTVVEQQKSTKDKLLRRKYMGVWSLGLILMMVIMPRFPTTVTAQMVRKTRNKETWRSGYSEKPKRVNMAPAL